MKKKPKKSLEDEINSFLEVFDVNCLIAILDDLYEIFKLYNVNEEKDWVAQIVGEDNKHVVRLVRTCYLASRLADNHAGRLCTIKAKFPNFWKKLEEMAKDESLVEERFEL